MAYQQVTLKVTPPVYQRVTAIKKALEDAAERAVSYSEVLEQLAGHWEAKDTPREPKPIFEMHYSEVRESGDRA